MHNAIFLLIAMGFFYLILSYIWARTRKYAHLARHGVRCPAVVAGYENRGNGLTHSAVMYVRAQTPAGERLLASPREYATKPYRGYKPYQKGEAIPVYYAEKYSADFIVANGETGEEEVAGYRGRITPRLFLLLTAIYWAAGFFFAAAFWLHWF